MFRDLKLVLILNESITLWFVFSQTKKEVEECPELSSIFRHQNIQIEWGGNGRLKYDAIRRKLA